MSLTLQDAFDQYKGLTDDSLRQQPRAARVGVVRLVHDSNRLLRESVATLERLRPSRRSWLQPELRSIRSPVAGITPCGSMPRRTSFAALDSMQPQQQAIVSTGAKLSRGTPRPSDLPSES